MMSSRGITARRQQNAHESFNRSAGSLSRRKSWRDGRGTTNDPVTRDNSGGVDLLHPKLLSRMELLTRDDGQEVTHLKAAVRQERIGCFQGVQSRPIGTRNRPQSLEIGSET